jgi:hypothetical protein
LFLFVGVLEELKVDPDTGVNYPEHHRVRLTIRNPNLEMEIWVPFMKPSELTADRVMTEVDKVIQSSKEWLLEAPMELLFVHAPVPAGRGSSALQRAGVSLEEFLKSKRSIVRVPAMKDNMCCARAIIIGQVFLEGSREMFRSIQKNVNRTTPFVKLLHQKSGVPEGVACGPQEWRLFQDTLGNKFDLVVVSRDFFNSIVFRGNPKAKNIICIYHANHHYHTITSLQGFLERSYLCKHCLTPYDHAGQHV